MGRQCINDPHELNFTQYGISNIGTLCFYFDNVSCRIHPLMRALHRVMLWLTKITTTVYSKAVFCAGRKCYSIPDALYVNTTRIKSATDWL